PSPKERGAETPGYLTGNSAVIKDTLQHAKGMRKEPTKAEALLWEALRNKNLGYKFRRQHPVGVFIGDFVALEKQLIVEVDGGYHEIPEQSELDEARTLELEQKHHYKVIRFTNEEVINDLESVLSQIRLALTNRKTYTKEEEHPSEAPPLSFGEGSGVRTKDGLGIRSFFSDIFSEIGDEKNQYKIEVFTTRPDTIFGVSFMTLAPEHELVAKITTPEQKAAVDAYVEATAKRSERDRMSDVKTISGVFTGGYAEHPFTKESIPVWIGDYVLAGYGTGAVMAVPAGDQRDYDFAKHFGIEIKQIFAPQPPKGEQEPYSIESSAFTDKDGFKLMNSDFLDGMNYKQATKAVIEALEGIEQGRGKTNYRLRDAVFSRQRYWGEPFPVYYVNGLPQMIDKEHLPIRLPDVEKYLPTEDGQPPLGNSREWAWDTANNKVVANDLIDDVTVFPLELNTMPGWAGSSWYWLRYMDPHNDEEFISDKAEAYWQDVDLYIGGSEHATGHLLYSRFWNKFLKDRGFITKEEPFKKLINQGMILGMSAFVYRVHTHYGTPIFISKNQIDGDKNIVYGFQLLNIGLKNFDFEKDKNIEFKIQPLHVDVNLVDSSNVLDKEKFKNHPLYSDYKEALFILEDNEEYIVGREVEKMSKSKYNVVTPDDICELYGADTLRLYEMFLGPLEQAKPWNTAGITGVSGFLKKLWKLYFDDNGLIVTANPGSKEAYKTLHKTIKKTQEDIENFSFNTSVSSFMIAVNELTAMNCHERVILEPLAILISPYAPHIAEELWYRLGHQGSISQVPFPLFNPEYLVESSKEYPVSFNGKTRFTIELPMDMSKEDIEKTILADERTSQQLGGQPPKKVIVVPGRIINIVG
ncbi:DUF559 domain-containing protein, partial [uncultured Flavobacterium sp.]|uniref:DUF559 domain-containing protein n=1 Tax=uncultured Flavobacterium sp. TaxID=165435 RepID=UPI0025D2F76D